MNKVTPINRALRPPNGPTGQVAANTDELGQVQGLLQTYDAREQGQQVAMVQQQFSDAVSQLNAKFDTHYRATELQLSSMQKMIESDRQNNLASIDNLKSLFDGNYQVMSGLATRYENDQAYVKNELLQGSATIEERIAVMHQESADRFEELRSAMEQAKQDERSRFALALRALADSLAE